MRHAGKPGRAAKGQELRLFGPREQIPARAASRQVNARYLHDVVGHFTPNVQEPTPSSSYAAVPMPYFPDVKGAPQNSIIGGASLWVMGGKKPRGIQGHCQVLHVPVRHRSAGQVYLHEVSGYLPITKAAYEKTVKDSGFYDRPTRSLEVPLEGIDQQGADRRIRVGCGLAAWCRCATCGRRKSRRHWPARNPPRRPSMPRSARGNARCSGTFEKHGYEVRRMASSE